MLRHIGSDTSIGQETLTDTCATQEYVDPCDSDTSSIDSDESAAGRDVHVQCLTQSMFAEVKSSMTSQHISVFWLH